MEKNTSVCFRYLNRQLVCARISLPRGLNMVQGVLGVIAAAVLGCSAALLVVVSPAGVNGDDPSAGYYHHPYNTVSPYAYSRQGGGKGMG